MKYSPAQLLLVLRFAFNASFTMALDRNAAANIAFRRLFKYISGEDSSQTGYRRG